VLVDRGMLGQRQHDRRNDDGLADPVILQRGE
jgi:hypothetical protein